MNDDPQNSRYTAAEQDFFDSLRQLKELLQPQEPKAVKQPDYPHQGDRPPRSGKRSDDYSIHPDNWEEAAADLEQLFDDQENEDL